MTSTFRRPKQRYRFRPDIFGLFALLSLIFTLSVVFGDGFFANANAADVKPRTASATVQNRAPAQMTQDAPSSGRSKKLEFDNSVIEGMNSQSKDSLESVEKREGGDRGHLYHLRPDFRKEIQLIPLEMGSSP
jgi:hypothetical protein